MKSTYIFLLETWDEWKSRNLMLGINDHKIGYDRPESIDTQKLTTIIWEASDDDDDLVLK